MEYKVRDFPSLVKRDGGVVNKNQDDYHRAKARLKQTKRIDHLEDEVRGLHSKIDKLLELLSNAQSK